MKAHLLRTEANFSVSARHTEA